MRTVFAVEIMVRHILEAAPVDAAGSRLNVIIAAAGEKRIAGRVQVALSRIASLNV